MLKRKRETKKKESKSSMSNERETLEGLNEREDSTRQESGERGL